MNTTPKERYEVNDHKKAIHEYIDTLGLIYTATFKPTLQPREAVEHPQLHWIVTLVRNGRTMETPYSQGMGHIEGYKQFHKTKHDRRLASERYRKTCETGIVYKDNLDGDEFNRFSPKAKQPTPDVLDVLYCLVSDSDVLEHSTYEEWARELGYDEDSRKGEATYRLCLQQSLALKNLIGTKALETLKELYQDY